MRSNRGIRLTEVSKKKDELWYPDVLLECLHTNFVQNGVNSFLRSLYAAALIFSGATKKCSKLPQMELPDRIP
jgi:hypothetical protein